MLKGYSGDLYVEIIAANISHRCDRRDKARINFGSCEAIRRPPRTAFSNELAEREHLVYYDNGDCPAEAVIERGMKKGVANEGGDQQAIIDRGLRATTDLEGE